MHSFWDMAFVMITLQTDVMMIGRLSCECV